MPKITPKVLVLVMFCREKNNNNNFKLLKEVKLKRLKNLGSTESDIDLTHV